MGPHCSLVSEKIVCLDVTLKAVVLKTPGQTNSGGFVCSKSLLRGALLRRREAPWWRILTKRAAIAVMRPHRAVFCHRSIAADCCSARFADEFRRRAFNASPAFQSVRWLFRSIGPCPHTPSVFCHRWRRPMMLGLRRYSMSAFYLAGRLARFLLGRICSGAK